MLSDTLKSNCNSYNTVLNFFIIFFLDKDLFIYRKSERRQEEKKCTIPLCYIHAHIVMKLKIILNAFVNTFKIVYTYDGSMQSHRNLRSSIIQAWFLYMSTTYVDFPSVQFTLDMGVLVTLQSRSFSKPVHENHEKYSNQVRM